VQSRVTILGGFSIFGLSFTLSSFEKQIAEVAQLFVVFFLFSVNVFLTKNVLGLGTFWSIFSQTNQVTLAQSKLKRALYYDLGGKSSRSEHTAVLSFKNLFSFGEDRVTSWGELSQTMLFTSKNFFW
jgi:hypothetical protein